MTTESDPTFPVDSVGTPVEQSTPTYSLARLGGRDEQKQARNKKGKASAETSEDRKKHIAQMLEFGVGMQERAKVRAEYEGNRLYLLRRKAKRGDEQWEYTKQEKEREAERWEYEKREKDATLMRHEMEILEKDLSKMTPRKKKYWRLQQNKILQYDQDDPYSTPPYSSHSSVGGGANDGVGGVGKGYKPNFQDLDEY